MSQLTTPVKYPVIMKGWHNGTLVLDNDVLALTADDGTVVFSTPVNKLTKIKRSSITLTFCTEKVKQSVSFGDVLAYMANTSGGRTTNLGSLTEAEQQIKSADSQLTPWLTVFIQRGIQIQGGNGMKLVFFERKAYFVYLTIFILGLIAIFWILVLRK